ARPLRQDTENPARCAGFSFGRHRARLAGGASCHGHGETIPPHLLNAARCLPDETRATSAVSRHGMSPASHQPAARAHARGVVHVSVQMNCALPASIEHPTAISEIAKAARSPVHSWA